MKRWTTNDIEILLSQFQTTDQKTLSKLIGRSEGAIRAKCFDLGLIKKDKWNNSDIEQIKSHYLKMSDKEIGKHLNRTENAVLMKRKKLGLVRPTVEQNRDYFHIIDSEDKAYWLGFLAADGWISYGKGTGNCVGLELQCGDKSHLQKFINAINGNIEIKLKKHDGFIINGRQIKKTESACIRLYSNNMVRDLEDKGFSSRKSFDLKWFANIPDDLIRHYVRGYFDGNGCLALSDKKHRTIKCQIECNSPFFTDSLLAVLKENNIKCYLNNDKNCYRVESVGLYGTHRWLQWMYEDATIFLDRKYWKKEKLYTQLNILERLPRCLETSTSKELGKNTGKL